MTAPWILRSEPHAPPAASSPVRPATTVTDIGTEQRIGISKLLFGDFAHFEADKSLFPAVNDYNSISSVFDAAMGLDFHAATHAIRCRPLSSFSASSPIRCLDLCCGTGLFFDFLVADRPISGHGVDLSSGQVAIAKGRMGSNRGEFTFEVGDVLGVELSSGFDLVTINFDALNHLGRRRDWQTVLVKAHRALRHGGRFVFDINLPRRLTHDWNTPEVILKDGLVYVQLAYPSRTIDGGVVRRTPMIILELNATGFYQRTHAMIEQFALPLSEVLEMVRAAGFTEVALLQGSESAPVGHIFNKNRAFISAHKE